MDHYRAQSTWCVNLWASWASLYHLDVRLRSTPRYEWRKQTVKVEEANIRQSTTGNSFVSKRFYITSLVIKCDGFTPRTEPVHPVKQICLPRRQADSSISGSACFVSYWSCFLPWLFPGARFQMAHFKCPSPNLSGRFNLASSLIFLNWLLCK